MRTWLLILFASLFLSACKSKNHIPNDVLPQLKMQAVLWDMIRADQFLADFVLNKDSSLNMKSESIKLYQQVFLIHHVTKEEFLKSFYFYRNHLSLLKVVMDSLSAISNTTSGELYQPKPLADTLQTGTNKLQHKKDSIFLRKKKHTLQYQK